MQSSQIASDDSRSISALTASRTVILVSCAAGHRRRVSYRASDQGGQFAGAEALEEDGVLERCIWSNDRVHVDVA